MFEGVFRGHYPDTLKSVLKAASLTHAEVSHNLANYETPGYRAQNTDFRSQLLDARGEKHGAAFEKYLEDVQPQGEGVNLERELSRLSQASLDQAAAVQLLSKRYQMLSQAISEGKR